MFWQSAPQSSCTFCDAVFFVLAVMPSCPRVTVSVSVAIAVTRTISTFGSSVGSAKSVEFHQVALKGAAGSLRAVTA